MIGTTYDTGNPHRNELRCSLFIETEMDQVIVDALRAHVPHLGRNEDGRVSTGIYQENPDPKEEEKLSCPRLVLVYIQKFPHA